MRKINWFKSFTKSYAKKAKAMGKETLDGLLTPVVFALANDQPLEPRYRDHALIGNWKGSRDCHIKPDLILIYRKPDPESLHLVRLGSHSELGL